MSTANNDYDIAVAFPLSSVELSTTALTDEEFKEIYPLSDDEFKEFQNQLDKHKISFGKPRLGIQMSVLSNVIIYINSHVTELLIAGILLPGAYDLIKNVVYQIAKKASNFYKKIGRDDTCQNIKMKIGNTEVIAPIPTNLNDKQFELYFSMLIKTIETIKESEIEKQNAWNCFVVEHGDDYTMLTYKTFLQYASERRTEQYKEKDKK